MGKLFVISLIVLTVLVGCKKSPTNEPEPQAMVEVQNLEVTQHIDSTDTHQQVYYLIEGDVVNTGEKQVYNVVVKINEGCLGMEKEIKGGGNFVPGESEHFEFTCSWDPYCCRQPFTWDLVWSE